MQYDNIVIPWTISVDKQDSSMGWSVSLDINVLALQFTFVLLQFIVTSNLRTATLPVCNPVPCSFCILEDNTLQLLSFLLFSVWGDRSISQNTCDAMWWYEHLNSTSAPANVCTVGSSGSIVKSTYVCSVESKQVPNTQFNYHASLVRHGWILWIQCKLAASFINFMMAWKLMYHPTSSYYVALDNCQHELSFADKLLALYCTERAKSKTLILLFYLLIMLVTPTSSLQLRCLHARICRCTKMSQSTWKSFFQK